MTDLHAAEHPEGGTPLARREFLRRAALLAAGAAAAPLLAACGDSAPPAPAAPTQQATQAPAPTATSQGAAAAAAPAAPATPEPTAMTPPTSTTEPTATTEATSQPTAPAEPTATAAAAEPPPAQAPVGAHDVALLASADRAAAVPAILGMLAFDHGWLKGRHVAVKANFNSADPPPGSTHLDTLRALLERLQDWGAAQITLVERSGMGNTSEVLRQRGATALAREFGARVVILDDLPARDWVKMQGAHWNRGFLLPRVIQEADEVVQTCCLKTHRFGGHFTMSLKNSVGLVAKFDPGDGYNYMGELHGSPDQRLMIAEINAAYKPALVLLDGVLAFVNGGPDQGKKVQAGLFLASRDRVALDAVAVAMLRHLGTTPEVSSGAIFDQPQIAHAAALGIGAPGPSAVTVRPAGDDASVRLAGALQKLLA